MGSSRAGMVVVEGVRASTFLRQLRTTRHQTARTGQSQHAESAPEPRDAVRDLRADAADVVSTRARKAELWAEARLAQFVRGIDACTGPANRQLQPKSERCPSDRQIRYMITMLPEGKTHADSIAAPHLGKL